MTMEWIKVNDRLPEPQTDNIYYGHKYKDIKFYVLAVEENDEIKYLIAAYIIDVDYPDDGGRWVSGELIDTMTPIAWMPFPNLRMIE